MSHVIGDSFPRLDKAIQWSQKQMQRPRDNRVKAIKQFVGYHVLEDGAARRVPVPFLALAVMIYVRQLAPKAPRALFTTAEERLKVVAADMELAVNQIPAEIGLASTLRRFVTEALFSMGILKVGLHTVGEAIGHAYGEPFVDLVQLDDYFMDAAAKRSDLIDFEGNDYWPRYDEIKEADWVEGDVKSYLKPDDFSLTGENGAVRADSLSNADTATVYKERIKLRDVWVPAEKKVITYGVTSERILRVSEWNELERGPYHKLGYTDVPGNLMPLPPSALWLDLHELGNTLFRKLGRQAEAQKTVLGFTGTDNEGVENFQKAADGEGINYAGGDAKKLEAGGVDQVTLGFFLQCRDLFSYFAGNLDSLGGLAPLTQTVGQDKLLGDAASSQIRDMATKTIETIRGVFEALAYYEWNDPIKVRTLEKPVPGTDILVPVKFGSKSKYGNFNELNIDVDQYSLQDDSPSAKLQRLGLVMQTYVGPLEGMIREAGGIIDVQAILGMVAKWADLPELADVVVFVDRPEGGPGSQPSGSPASTTKEVIRTGRPGMTERGASKAAQQQLFGGKLQDSEASQLR